MNSKDFLKQANSTQLKGIWLAQGQSLSFVHMSYFPDIENWARQCLEIAPNGIDNAFQDYLRVLDRIHPKRVWRKVITWDQYTLSLSDKNQKQICSYDRGKYGKVRKTLKQKDGPYRFVDEPQKALAR